MTEFNGTSCRLCLKNITDKGFQIIDDVTRNILNALLPKLKIHDDGNEVICDACNRKLNAAYVFKLTCLNTNNTIILHMDSEKLLQPGLGEIYKKQNGSEHLIDISFDHKICQMCMELIKSEIKCIGEEELEAIHKFVPEMSINIKDPVVCKPCFDSVCVHNTFLKDCLEVEQKIGDIFKSSVMESQTDTSLSDLFIKTENLERESEINKMETEIAVKTECVDIKSDEEASDKLLLHSNKKIFENSECNEAEEKDHKVYKCETCEYVTEKKGLLKKHIFKHKNTSEVQMYKCKECNYESRYKCSFNRHQLKHKDPSEVQMYTCNDCEYKTKYKNGMKHHVLQHKDPSRIQMYKCKECNYESRYKHSVNNHQLTHKSPSEAELYKCKDCDYKAKSKNNLACHALYHKDFLLEQMYKCSDCNYQTKFRKNLRYHTQKHKNPSQIKMYKCEACNYESMYKHSVNRHQIKHKSPSEVQMYRCNDCDYKTKHKDCLKLHAIKHANPSQMQVDKRDASHELHEDPVHFKSGCKDNVISHHSTVHEEVQMYRCNDCSYKSKYKRSLIRHVLLHKDPSLVQMYKCNVCDYEFRHKNNLSAHQLTHIKSSFMEMYKCDICNFETKYKRSLKIHSLKHKRKLLVFKCNS